MEGEERHNTRTYAHFFWLFPYLGQNRYHLRVGELGSSEYLHVEGSYFEGATEGHGVGQERQNDQLQPFPLHWVASFSSDSLNVVETISARRI